MKTIKLNTGVIKAAANKIIIRGNLVGEPSNNNSLSTSVCADRIAIRNAIDNRRKPRTEIKVIHNQKVILCASKDGTFERENCFVTPLDGLNGRDAARLRAPWLHFAKYIPNKFGEFESKKKSQGRATPLGANGLKNSASKRANYNFSPFSLLLSSRCHYNQDQN